MAELIASGAVPTTGQLARNVILVIRIEASDLDTRLGLLDPEDVMLGAVVVSAADTAANTSLADLIADINQALSTTAIPRYEGPGTGLPLHFDDYVRAELREGVLVFVGTQPFKVKSASRNVPLLGMTRGEDLTAAYVFFNAFITGEADVPAAILAGDVTLDMVINRAGEYSSAAIVISPDGANTSLADLVLDINAELLLAGFGDITAALAGSRLVFTSLYDFTMEGSSTGAGLLGLTAVAAGTDVNSSRQASQYELAGAHAIPTTGILAEDVTLDVITTDSEDHITHHQVTVARADTLGNLSIDDLAETVEAALHAAGFDIAVDNVAGTLVFTSLTVDIEISSVESTAADLLGLFDVAAGAAETSSRDPSLFELTPADPLSTAGVLPDNIAFSITMAALDPNDDPGRIWPEMGVRDPVTGALIDPITDEPQDIVTGTVTIFRADTLDNVGLTDTESLNALVDDINAALIRAGFREISAALDGSGRIVLSSTHAFELDVENAVLRADAALTSPDLEDNVALYVRMVLPTGTITGHATTYHHEYDSLDDLCRAINVALGGSDLNALKVRLVGDYLEFHSRYPFTILGVSPNAELFGLTRVGEGTNVKATRSPAAFNAYVAGFSSVIDAAQVAERPEEVYRVKAGSSMVNGVLAHNLTLHLSIGGGTHTGAVTVLASATNGLEAETVANAGIADLVRDINRALVNTEIPSNPGSYFGSFLRAEDQGGVVVLIGSDSFTLTSGAADHLDQLGFGLGTFTSALSTPGYEVEANVQLPATGILTGGVTLVVAIDDGAGGTWTTTVVIPQSDTATNTGRSDLLMDIENALTITEVLDDGTPTGAYASQFLVVESRSDRLVLSGAREFTIDGDASINGAIVGSDQRGAGQRCDRGSAAGRAGTDATRAGGRRVGWRPAAGELRADRRCDARSARHGPAHLEWRSGPVLLSRQRIHHHHRGCFGGG